MTKRTPRKPLFLSVAIVLGAALLPARAVPAESPASPNVVLVSLDTLRADRLGCYGESEPVTPNMDALAEESVRFDRCASAAPSTLPSHASLFTSRYPSQHRANWMTRTPLRGELPTWAEFLKEAGYRTASFNGGGQLLEEFGIGRGFDTYLSLRALEQNKRNDGLLKNSHRAIGWLEGIGNKPFFLFLHTYDVHVPLTPPDRYRRYFAGDYDGILPNLLFMRHFRLVNNGGMTVLPEDVDYLRGMNKAEVRYADDLLGGFMDHLRNGGQWENTIFILMSDHGDDYGERGLFGSHAHSLHKEVINVPLIIKFPGQDHAGATVESWVSLVDLLPTLLDYLDIETDTDFAGKSMLPLLENDERDDFRLYAEKERQEAGDGAEGAAMITPRYRVIRDYDPDEDAWTYEAYDWQKDPAESENLFVEGEDPWAALRSELDTWASSQRRHDETETESISLPDESVEQLRALGYVGG